MKKPGFTLQSAKVPAPEGAAAVYALAELVGHAPAQPVEAAKTVAPLLSTGEPKLVVAQTHVPPLATAFTSAQSGVQPERSAPSAEVPPKGHAVGVSTAVLAALRMSFKPAQYLFAGAAVQTAFTVVPSALER